jgi:GGDEF domain-containing protein
VAIKGCAKMVDFRFENNGVIDLLTGLDAPGIFYNFLEREISFANRIQRRSCTLVVFRIRSGFERGDLPQFLVEFAYLLKKKMRSDEFLSRIGEMTFVLVIRSAEVNLENDDLVKIYLESIKIRFKKFIDQYALAEKRVENINELFPVDIKVLSHNVGEKLADFLDRAEI